MPKLILYHKYKSHSEIKLSINFLILAIVFLVLRCIIRAERKGNKKMNGTLGNIQVFDSEDYNRIKIGLAGVTGFVIRPLRMKIRERQVWEMSSSDAVLDIIEAICISGDYEYIRNIMTQYRDLP